MSDSDVGTMVAVVLVVSSDGRGDAFEVAVSVDISWSWGTVTDCVSVDSGCCKDETVVVE